MPASVSQDVRVQLGQSCSITGSLDHLGDVRARHRAATLGSEHKSRFRRAVKARVPLHEVNQPGCWTAVKTKAAEHQSGRLSNQNLAML